MTFPLLHPNTRYYALVTTGSYGQATVEFHTSANTGFRSYSVKAESPRSKDSDDLLVELFVYSRKTLVAGEISTTLQPILTTVIPTRSPPVTTLPVTTIQEPVQTTLPAHTPTPQSPLAAGAGILAAVLCLFLMRRH